MKKLNIHAFSLIEMSILIAILGVFAVSILTQLPTQKEYERVTELEDSMDTIREAIDIYLSNNNYLPCPADGTLKLDNANFGVPTDCAVAPTSGVTDIDDVAAGTDDDVRIGVIPTKELGLKSNAMFDEWGNRYMYAVHKDLTNATDYAAYPTSSVGGIIIQDSAATQINSGVVPYLLMSHGKDGRGAYTKAGVYNDCSSETVDADKVNCAWKTTTGQTALTFTTDIIHDAPTSTDFFYDKLAWGEIPAAPTPPAFSQLYAIAAGARHGCGILQSTQKIWCWGDVNSLNSRYSTPTPVSLPYEISTTETWTSIDSDTFSTCALTTGGNAYCWGDPEAGKMGNNTHNANPPLTTPTLISSTNDDGATITGPWTQLKVDVNHTCGIANGVAYCWGRDGTDGRLGNGTAKTVVDVRVPSRVINDDDSTYSSDWTQIHAGSDASCGIRNSGRLYCWGSNTHNVVGPSAVNSTSDYREYPYETGSPYTDWNDVVTDDSSACAIRAGGKLYCWGMNDNGQAGVGTTGGTYDTPQEVTALGDGWEQITTNRDGMTATNETTTCGIHTGRVYCWGAATSFGKIGNDTTNNYNVPTAITAHNYNDYNEVDMSSDHVCAVRDNGELYCWGRNSNNQFQYGNGDTISDREPMPAANGLLFN